MSEENESFYHKYFIHIWYVVGLCVVIASGTMSEENIKYYGLLLPLLYTLIVAVFVGYLLYIATMSILIKLSRFFGIFEDLGFDMYFAGIYILSALYYYLYWYLFPTLNKIKSIKIKAKIPTTPPINCVLK